LKILASKITDAKSTSGDDIKNENVTPTGNPAFVNPIKIGIDEQEQKGVTVPNKAPTKCPEMPLYLDKVCLVLSGVILDCIYADR
jgi:hypothetical protein